MVIFCTINIHGLNFIQIFFTIWVILGHFGGYGVKFRTSSKVDKLYLKLKLEVISGQKSWKKGQKSSNFGLNQKEGAKSNQYQTTKKKEKCHIISFKNRFSTGFNLSNFFFILPFSQFLAKGDLEWPPMLFFYLTLRGLVRLFKTFLALMRLSHH